MTDIERALSIDKALEIAVHAHAGKVDLAGVPYILHPLRLATKFADSDLKTIVALLHDVVEDTFATEVQVTVADLKREFDSTVAIAVDHLTRGRIGMVPFDSVAYDHDELYLDEYIPRVAMNPLAIEIKLADLADNMDVGRLPKLADNSITRLKRYHRAKLFLEKKQEEHREFSLDMRIKGLNASLREKGNV
jgi:(p)ppGpp synthase/HD superfamily hydrolase